MIKPMLAMPMDKADIRDWRDWAIEEKFDGHRLVVEVAHPEDRAPQVRAWTRPRKHAGAEGKTMAPRALPRHLEDDLLTLPVGVYDGELLGGETSTDVTRTDLQHALRFVVFDVMRLRDVDVMSRPYAERRGHLEMVFRNVRGWRTKPLPHVFLAESCRLQSSDDVVAFAQEVWARGGEGAMLKRLDAPYQPGKRSRDLIKVKKLQTRVCTVVAFEATRGKVLTHRGLFGSVVVRDSDGNETSVKVKNDDEIAALQRAWERLIGHVGNALTQREQLTLANAQHPALGRKLRIEYQDWTPRGGYRHPRWDRWEDE